MCYINILTMIYHLMKEDIVQGCLN
jgi:hypothetical protein